MDRGTVDALRAIDAMRSARRAAGPAPGTFARPALLLLGFALLQTATALTIVMPAIAARRPTGQAALAAGFAAASMLLAGAAARDPRALPLAAAFMIAASAFARAVMEAAPAPGIRAGWMFAAVHLEAFVPALLWQFAAAFPRVVRFTVFDVAARHAVRAAWAAGLLLFSIAVIGHASPVLDSIARALARDAPGNLFWHLFAALSLPALGAILVRARRAEPRERRKVVRVAYALAAGAAPLLVVGLLRLLVPQIDRWMISGAAARPAVDAVVVAGLALIPLLTCVALLRDRPFGGRLLPSWLTARTTRLADAFRPGAPRRLAVVRHHQLTWVLGRLREARAPRELREVVCRELRFALGAAVVDVLDPDALPPPSALLAILAEESPVDVGAGSELAALLPPAERAWLASRGIELAAAITGRDGRLAAWIAVGARRGGGYDGADRWFIAAVAAAAAVAFDEGDGAPMPPDEDAAVECVSCGSVQAHAPLACGCHGPPRVAAVPARVAGKFLTLRRLGAGGMGIVYLARDLTLGRLVVLKALPRGTADAMRALRDEARAMAALSHPHIATIYGLEVWRGSPMLVVEYLAGGTLKERLADGRLPREDAVRLGVRLADALDYMHQRGVLHRDVKPGNIGFTAAGVVKVIDFGLAGGAAAGGTRAYLPPEALEGAPPGPAVDLWGLALCLREACGPDAAAQPPLFDFFRRALNPAPAERYSSARDVRLALEKVLTDPAPQ